METPAKKVFRRNQTIVLTIIGVVTCLLGLLLSTPEWDTRLSPLTNIGMAEIVTEGKRVVIQEGRVSRSETPGRVAVPLRYVLVVGVILTAVGFALLLIQPKNGDRAGHGTGGTRSDPEPVDGTSRNAGEAEARERKHLDTS